MKMYREWNSADIEDQPGLEKMAGHTFANVDDEIFEEPLKTWVHNCKYGVPNSTRARFTVPKSEPEPEPSNPF